MGFWTVFLLLFTTTALISAHEGNPVDVNSVAALATNLNNKFQQLFHRFDQLESKVNRILQRKRYRAGLAIVDDYVGPEEADEDLVPSESAVVEAQLNASLKEVNRLQNILSQRKCNVFNSPSLYKSSAYKSIILLIPVVFIPACQKNPARVPEPMVLAKVRAPQNISCHSGGEAISTCLWGHAVNGSRHVVIVDQHNIENGGQSTIDGLSHAGGNDELSAGSCTLSIENVTKHHAGLWACNLISENLTIFSGAVHLGK